MRLTLDMSRSYKTERGLRAYLVRHGFGECTYLVARNSEGRFTAIFGRSWNGEAKAPALAGHGFKVIW